MEEVTERNNEIEEVVKKADGSYLQMTRKEQKIADIGLLPRAQSAVQPLINLFQPSLKKSRQRNLLLKKSDIRDS